MSSVPAILLRACQEGDEKAVKQLLEAGIDPNVQDAAGWTPLMVSARGGHKVVVNLLLTATKRAQPRTANKAGKTALHLACQHGHAAIAHVLLLYGADPTARDSLNHTPLDDAAEAGEVGVLTEVQRRSPEIALPIKMEPPVVYAANSSELGVQWEVRDESGPIKTLNPLARVTAFRLEVARPADRHWRSVGDTLTGPRFRITGLDPDEAYITRVSACNAYGWGVPSDESAVMRTTALGSGAPAVAAGVGGRVPPSLPIQGASGLPGGGTGGSSPSGAVGGGSAGGSAGGGGGMSSRAASEARSRKGESLASASPTPPALVHSGDGSAGVDLIASDTPPTLSALDDLSGSWDAAGMSTASGGAGGGGGLVRGRGPASSGRPPLPSASLSSGSPGHPAGSVGWSASDSKEAREAKGKGSARSSSSQSGGGGGGSSGATRSVGAVRGAGGAGGGVGGGAGPSGRAESGKRGEQEEGKKSGRSPPVRSASTDAAEHRPQSAFSPRDRPKAGVPGSSPSDSATTTTGAGSGGRGSETRGLQRTMSGSVADSGPGGSAVGGGGKATKGGFFWGSTVVVGSAASASSPAPAGAAPAGATLPSSSSSLPTAHPGAGVGASGASSSEVYEIDEYDFVPPSDGAADPSTSASAGTTAGTGAGAGAGAGAPRGVDDEDSRPLLIAAVRAALATGSLPSAADLRRLGVSVDEFERSMIALAMELSTDDSSRVTGGGGLPPGDSSSSSSSSSSSTTSSSPSSAAGLGESRSDPPSSTRLPALRATAHPTASSLSSSSSTSSSTSSSVPSSGSSSAAVGSSADPSDPRIVLRAMRESLHQEKLVRQEAERRAMAADQRVRGLEKRMESTQAEVARLRGEASVVSGLTASQLAELEAELEASLRSVRQAKEIKMREELGEEKEKQSCVVCMTQPKTVLLLPCKHLCLCHDCAQKLIDGAKREAARAVRRDGTTAAAAAAAAAQPKCPICRATVAQTLDVYS